MSKVSIAPLWFVHKFLSFCFLNFCFLWFLTFLLRKFSFRYFLMWSFLTFFWSSFSFWYVVFDSSQHMVASLICLLLLSCRQSYIISLFMMVCTVTTDLIKDSRLTTKGFKFFIEIFVPWVGKFI